MRKNNEKTRYELEYNEFYEDVMFRNEELDNFKTNIIYINNTNKNIIQYPTMYEDKKMEQEELNKKK